MGDRNILYHWEGLCFRLFCAGFVFTFFFAQALTRSAKSSPGGEGVGAHGQIEGAHDVDEQTHVHLLQVRSRHLLALLARRTQRVPRLHQLLQARDNRAAVYVVVFVCSSDNRNWLNLSVMGHADMLFLGDLRSLVRFVSFWKKRAKSE